MVFAQLGTGLLQSVINILFKIFICSSILSIYSRNLFIKQNQLFLWQCVDDIPGVLFSFYKMRYNYIMRIIFILVGQKPFKQGKVIVVDVKINRYIITKCRN